MALGMLVSWNVIKTSRTGASGMTAGWRAGLEWYRRHRRAMVNYDRIPYVHEREAAADLRSVGRPEGRTVTGVDMDRANG